MVCSLKLFAEKFVNGGTNVPLLHLICMYIYIPCNAPSEAVFKLQRKTWCMGPEYLCMGPYAGVDHIIHLIS